MDHGQGKKGKVMVTMIALYGLKTSGAALRNVFAEKFQNTDAVMAVADTVIYCRWERKPNGKYYY